MAETALTGSWMFPRQAEEAYDLLREDDKGAGNYLRALLGGITAGTVENAGRLGETVSDFYAPQQQFARELFGVSSSQPPAASPVAPQLPKTPAQAAQQGGPSIQDMMSIQDLMYGGSSRRGGGGGKPANFSETKALMKQYKTQLDAIPELDLPEYRPLKDQYAERMSELETTRPKQGDYKALEGANLSKFMIDLGMNLLASNTGKQPMVANLGQSLKGATEAAEGRTGRQYAEGMDIWKENVNTAKSLIDLGSKDYTELTNREKLKRDDAILKAQKLLGLVEQTRGLEVAEATDRRAREQMSMSAERRGAGPVQQMLKIADFLKQKDAVKGVVKSDQEYMSAAKEFVPQYRPDNQKVEKVDEVAYNAAKQSLSQKYGTKVDPTIIESAALNVGRGVSLGGIDQFIQAQLKAQSTTK